MRLTEEQVLAAFERPGRDVRYAAARWFAVSASPNTAAMPAAIAAIELHGPAAFLTCAPIADLAQTPATIEWTVGQLEDSTLDPSLREHLSRLLRSADPRLLAPHELSIRKSQTLWPELRRDCAQRIRLLELDAPALWLKLERLCDSGRKTLKSGEIDYRGGERIVDALACDPANAQAALDRLAATADCACDLKSDEPDAAPPAEADHSGAWMECFLTLLVGQMRLPGAIPGLVDKLHRPGQILSEESLRALIRIGAAPKAGDRVATELRTAIAEADDAFRRKSSVALGGIRSDVAVEALIAALAAEPELEHKAGLAEWLVGQFSTDANEAVRELLLAHPQLEPEALEELVVSATILGQEFPELAEWRTKAAALTHDRESQIAAFKAAPVRRDPVAPLRGPKSVGRNETCPCGSGKKFKKCCLARVSRGV